MKVNIYTPTYHRFEETRRSLESIIPHVESSVYDTTLYICDNNSPEGMKHWLSSLAGDKVKVYFSEENVGKPAIINYVYEQSTDCTHVMSIDSDMVADEESNFIDGMVWSIEHFGPLHGFGVLSSFQKEHNCHEWDWLTEKVKVEEQEVSYGKYNGVAGGCIILRKENWEKVGKYSTVGGVYGFDDAILMQDIYCKHKLKTGVINTVRLTHPFDSDKQYILWKQQNAQRQKRKGYYEENQDILSSIS